MNSAYTSLPQRFASFKVSHLRIYYTSFVLSTNHSVEPTMLNVELRKMFLNLCLYNTCIYKCSFTGKHTDRLHICRPLCLADTHTISRELILNNRRLGLGRLCLCFGLFFFSFMLPLSAHFSFVFVNFSFKSTHFS